MKKITVQAIPERLRLAGFKGTEADEEELEAREEEQARIFSDVFFSILTGTNDYAYWTIDGGTDARGREFVRRCVLTRSARIDGLQLTNLLVTDGEPVPVSHQDFTEWDTEKFVDYSGNPFQEREIVLQ